MAGGSDPTTPGGRGYGKTAGGAGLTLWIYGSNSSSSAFQIVNMIMIFFVVFVCATSKDAFERNIRDDSGQSAYLYQHHVPAMLTTCFYYHQCETPWHTPGVGERLRAHLAAGLRQSWSWEYEKPLCCLRRRITGRVTVVDAVRSTIVRAPRCGAGLPSVSCPPLWAEHKTGSCRLLRSTRRLGCWQRSWAQQTMPPYRRQ